MVLQAIQYTPSSDSGPPSLKILDQLLLPHRSFFFPIQNCEDAHAAIKQMQVRGAPAIAIVAALALAVELGQTSNNSSSAESASSIRQYIGERLSYLKTSRPTAVNLGDAVRKLNTVVKNAAAEKKADGSRVVGQYIAAAEQMLVDDVADNKAIGAHGAKWIQEHTPAGEKRSAGGEHELKILTHCNTGSLATAGYGTALGVIRSLRSSNMLSHAYCSETRPYHQGSRLTAYELVHDKIPATLVTDSMVAALLAKEGEKMAAIIVGADRVAANGDTANKIGTYSLAVLARHHGVKFLVAAPRTTIDLATPSGDSIVIEERAAEEVVRLKGPKVDRKGKVMAEEEPETISIAALGINVWNPAFDVTPAYLIDGVITEVGVIEKASTDEYFDFRHIFDTDTLPNGH